SPQSLLGAGWLDAYVLFEPRYQVRALFANGASAASAPAQVAKPALSSDFAVVRGPDGRYYLTALSLPPGISAVRLLDSTLAPGSLPEFSLAASNFVNGVCPLPDDVSGYVAGGFQYDAQAMADDHTGG